MFVDGVVLLVFGKLLQFYLNLLGISQVPENLALQRQQDRVSIFQHCLNPKSSHDPSLL